jgi:hypothetical protein
MPMAGLLTFGGIAAICFAAIGVGLKTGNILGIAPIRTGRLIQRRAHEPAAFWWSIVGFAVVGTLLTWAVIATAFFK